MILSLSPRSSVCPHDPQFVPMILACSMESVFQPSRRVHAELQKSSGAMHVSQAAMDVVERQHGLVPMLINRCNLCIINLCAADHELQVQHVVAHLRASERARGGENDGAGEGGRKRCRKGAPELLLVCINTTLIDV